MDKSCLEDVNPKLRARMVQRKKVYSPPARNPTVIRKTKSLIPAAILRAKEIAGPIQLVRMESRLRLPWKVFLGPENAPSNLLAIYKRFHSHRQKLRGPLPHDPRKAKEVRQERHLAKQVFDVFENPRLAYVSQYTGTHGKKGVAVIVGPRATPEDVKKEIVRFLLSVNNDYLEYIAPNLR